MSGRKHWAHFPLLWSLIWAAVVVPFDGIIAWQAYHKLRSVEYPSVPGVVTQSRVKRSQSSEGTSYAVDIRYVYEVVGQAYENDRYSYGLFSSASDRAAEGVVRRLPVGQGVDVFYNPADPADSTLQTGLEGLDLFLPLFLTPFNLIMVGGVWSYWAGASIVRDKRLSPLALAGVTMLAVTFVLIFVVGFSAGINPPIPLMQAVWAFVMAVTCAAYVAARWRAGRRLAAEIRLPNSFLV